MTLSRLPWREAWIDANRDRFPPFRTHDPLADVSEGYCPFCGAGPFVVPACHTALVHEVTGPDLRRLLGLKTRDSIAHPAYTENRRRQSIESNRAAALVGKWGKGRHGQRFARKGHRDPDHDAPPQPPIDLPAQTRHGTTYAYDKCGCRCVECRSGNRERKAANR